MELGIYTFAELPDDAAGRRPAARLRDLLEEAELADQLGLDVFGVGEHHRPDFAVSAPAVVLAAIAERTKQIRLTSAVTVLSSDDPVRVFEQFATLDLLSGGRAEIMAGRGSFIESFPLFGYDLDDYDSLFAEKLELLLRLREDERVTWSGQHRPPLDGIGVYPRPQQEIPVWVAVGGNPDSAARAGLLGLPMALAIIGGMPERFAPFAEIHRRAARQAGHDPDARAEHQLARVHRRDLAAGAGRVVPRGGGDDEPDRPRARLDADAAPGLRRRRDETRRELRRKPAAGDREDPLPARDLRTRPLSRAVQRRHDAAREDDALDRAVRHRGGSRGTQGAGVGGAR